MILLELINLMETSMESRKVLLVEDIEIAQKMATMILEGLGCSVDIAENGQQALQKYQNNHYDMVFMDIGLPDTTGIEVAKEIRRLENDNHKTPIVALTAHNDDSYRTASLNVGMNDFMVKPLTKDGAQSMLNKFT